MATKINFTIFDGHVVYKEKLYHRANMEFNLATMMVLVCHPGAKVLHNKFKIITPLGDDGRNCVVHFYNANTEEECTEENMLCYIPFEYYDGCWSACPSDAWRQLESCYGLKPVSKDDIKRINAMLEEGLLNR